MIGRGHPSQSDGNQLTMCHDDERENDTWAPGLIPPRNPWRLAPTFGKAWAPGAAHGGPNTKPDAEWLDFCCVDRLPFSKARNPHERQRELGPVWSDTSSKFSRGLALTYGQARAVQYVQTL